jgi:hypothetical protein
MYRIALRIFLLMGLAGDVLAHPGHAAPTLHSHGWEYALLAVVIVMAGVGWFSARKP